jgi:hypothetical protein
MYLTQPGTSRTKNKWGMGELRRHARAVNRHAIQCACAAATHYGALGTGIEPTRNKWRMGSLALQPSRLRGLGDATDPLSENYDVLASPPPYSGSFDATVAPSLVPSYQPDISTGYVTGNTPSYSSGAQNPNPVTGGASNGGITTVPAGQPSQSPLDYVSPQAAIAAGLNPTTVYQAWGIGVSKFSSPQAAVNAGIPAGVVNQMWQATPVAASSSSGTIFGMSPTTLMFAVAAAFTLPLLFGGGKRRR